MSNEFQICSDDQCGTILGDAVGSPVNLDAMPGAVASAGPGVDCRPGVSGVDCTQPGAGANNLIIDGSHTPWEWTLSPTADVDSCSEEDQRYMTVDLGGSYELTGATIWHFHGTSDKRAYCAQKIAIRRVPLLQHHQHSPSALA